MQGFEQGSIVHNLISLLGNLDEVPKQELRKAPGQARFVRRGPAEMRTGVGFLLRVLRGSEGYGVWRCVFGFIGKFVL